MSGRREWHWRQNTQLSNSWNLWPVDRRGFYTLVHVKRWGGPDTGGWFIDGQRLPIDIEAPLAVAQDAATVFLLMTGKIAP